MHLCPQIRMNVQRKLMLAQLSHHVSILLVHTAVIVRLVGEIEVHTPTSMLTSAWWDLTVVHQIHGVLILQVPTAASVWQVGEPRTQHLCWYWRVFCWIITITIGSYLCRCKSGFTQPYSRCTTGSHSCSSYGNAYCVNTIGCNRCYYMSGRSCNRK